MARKPGLRQFAVCLRTKQESIGFVQPSLSRRQLLVSDGKVAGAALARDVFGPRPIYAARVARITIVGGGVAGLAAALMRTTASPQR